MKLVNYFRSKLSFSFVCSYCGKGIPPTSAWVCLSLQATV